MPGACECGCADTCVAVSRNMTLPSIFFAVATLAHSEISSATPGMPAPAVRVGCSAVGACGVAASTMAQPALPLHTSSPHNHTAIMRDKPVRTLCTPLQKHLTIHYTPTDYSPSISIARRTWGPSHDMNSRSSASPPRSKFQRTCASQFGMMQGTRTLPCFHSRNRISPEK